MRLRQQLLLILGSSNDNEEFWDSTKGYNGLYQREILIDQRRTNTGGIETELHRPTRARLKKCKCQGVEIATKDSRWYSDDLLSAVRQ